MVMENGGLDAQVEQRMDAYRGNPQKLQQRYGQNKELLDLLALQKLTSEKKAVAADMQLKQSQQPGTIAQQREQEALDLTKQEMGGTLGELAGRTQGTLGNKQKTQQKNMQKMAQAASRPPQAQGGIGGLMGGAARPQPSPATPPQAQGIAGARMAQAQQRPPVRMAQGGIVAFAEGQQVQSGSPVTRYISETYRGMKDNAAESRLRRQVETMYGPYSAPIGGLFNQSDSNRARAKGIIDKLQSGKLSTEEMQALVTQFPEFRQNAAQIETAPIETAPMDTDMSLQGPVVPTAAPVEEGIASLGPTTRPNNAPTPDAVVPTPEQTAAEFTVPQTAGTSGGGGAMPAQSMTNADSAFLKGTGMADEYTGRADANASYEDMKGRLAEFDAENYGPNGDLNSFLIGMGGTGSIGSAMKGGYSSMLRSKNNRRNRLMDEFKLEKDRIGADAAFSSAGIQLGTQLAADAAANERSIRSAAATLGAAKMRAATADADRLANVYKAELKAVDDASGRAVQMAQNERLGDQTRLNAAINVQGEVADARSSLMEDQMSKSRVLFGLEGKRSKAADNGDQEVLAAIDKNIAAEIARIAVTVESVLNTPTPSGLNLLDLETTAADTIRALMRATGVNEDDVVKRTIKD